MSSIPDAVPSAPAPLIPHFGRIYLTVIWLGGVLFGMNCLIYGASLFVLFRRRRPAWLLVIWSTLLFCLSFSDAIVAFVQLYRPLTNDAIIGVPGAWDASYVLPDSLDFAHSELYTSVVIAQDLLLIWRLWGVWGYNWKIALPPLILEGLHTALSFYSTHFLHNAGQNAFGAAVQHWGLASWSLDIVINTSVTLAIAGRVWWIGRAHRAARRTSWDRVYMFTVIESGAIFAGATIICFALDVSGSIGGVAGIYLLTQLASITPLLIIVRVGLGMTHGDAKPNAAAAATSLKPLAYEGREDENHYAMSPVDVKNDRSERQSSSSGVNLSDGAVQHV